MGGATMNEAEVLLQKVHAGEMDSEAFMKELMDTTLFMPIYEKHEIAGFAPAEKATPLTLDDEFGEKVLILFTSPDRAKPFVKAYPGYGGGLLTDLKWILEKVGVGYSISINPGDELGIDFEVGSLPGRTVN